MVDVMFRYHGVDLPIMQITSTEGTRAQKITRSILGDAQTNIDQTQTRLVICGVPPEYHAAVGPHLARPADRSCANVVFPESECGTGQLALYVLASPDKYIFLGASVFAETNTILIAQSAVAVRMGELTRDLTDARFAPFCRSEYGSFAERQNRVDCADLARKLLSYALRVHCDNKQQRAAHLYGKTFRYFARRSARQELFSDGGMAAGLAVARFVRSNVTRKFARNAVVGAVELITRTELSGKTPGVQLDAVTKHIGFLRDLFRAKREHPDAIERTATGLRFRFSSNWAFLLPSKDVLVGGLARVRKDFVELTAEGAVRMLPLYTKRVLENTPNRTGCSTVHLAQSVDLEVLDSLATRLPLARGMFANDGRRPTDLDDLLLSEPRPSPFKLFQLDLPKFKGLTCERTQLELPAANWFLRSGHTVPASALARLMVRGKSADPLKEVEQLARAVTRKSSVSQAEYAQDEDDALVRDSAWREWFCSERQKAKEEQLCSSTDSCTPTLVDEQSRPGAVTDIEDMFANVYRNDALPPCQAKFAKRNIDEQQHPRDAGRVTYYPFLRSLHLPKTDVRHVITHMLRNEEPGDYANRMLNEYRGNKAKLCRDKLAKSHAGHLKNGRSEDDARKLASCSGGCRSLASAGHCPFALGPGAPIDRVMRLQDRVSAIEGASSADVADVVRTARREGGATLACRSYYALTHRDRPFPKGAEVRIYHPRDYVYLSALHAERTQVEQ